MDDLFWLIGIVASIFLLIKAIKWMINLKFSVSSTIKPFAEWMAIAKSKNNVELEAMSHALLIDTGNLLERADMISKKEFMNILSRSRGYTSNIILLILSTVETQEKFFLEAPKNAKIRDPRDFPLHGSQPANIYMHGCLCRLYYDGFIVNETFYSGINALILIASYATDRPQESWN